MARSPQVNLRETGAGRTVVPVGTQNSTLYVADVRKAFGRRQVLDRVDFTLERGELAGIVGDTAPARRRCSEFWPANSNPTTDGSYREVGSVTVRNERC